MKSNVVLAEIDANYTFWQRSLIPTESVLVRSAMRQAAKFGTSDNLFYAHVVSVALAISAVVFSFFNGLSYVLQIPLKFLLNIVRFQPVQMVIDLYYDIRNGLLSFFFVSMGVTFVVAGFLFPEPFFTFFAPEYFDTKEEKLSFLNDRLQKEKDGLITANQEKAKKIEKVGAFLQKQQEEEEKKGFFGRIRALWGYTQTN